jgi:UPF0042 nucleotide-binding protein
MTSQELASLVSTRVVARNSRGISLLFRSFGFKYGVPVDADMVFDLRCLPNPHWEESLRPLTGKDAPVQEYLASQSLVAEMIEDICTYLDTWIPRFEANARVYMTVALGCTGGQHRSVFVAERMAEHFTRRYTNVLVRHRELARHKPPPASARTG